MFSGCQSVFQKTNIIYALNGAISGLVSITADPLSPSGYEATLIGAVGGLICYGALVAFEQFFKVDDPVVLFPPMEQLEYLVSWLCHLLMRSYIWFSAIWRCFNCALGLCIDLCVPIFT